MRALIILLVVQLSGCCWMSKRSCFPECSRPEPPKVVTVERTCNLPPKIKLPRVVQTPCELPSGRELVCYDMKNAALLAKREADMKEWIRDVRARCGSQSGRGRK